jgi:uncharacterized protein involved in cysteine biosynthesis
MRGAVGFGRGFVAPFRAMGLLLRSPTSWPLALVPPALFGLLEVAFVVLAWRYLAPRVKGALTHASWLEWLYFDALRELVPQVASLGAVVLVAWLGWRLAAPLAAMLSAPALERLVGLAEVPLRVPARPALGFFTELACGMRSMLLGLALTLPLEVGLTLAELVFPPIVPLTTPLKLGLGALGVAWGLFDYPLTLRGMSARERFAFMVSHLTAVLGFGVAFSLLFWIPCFGTLMLPVGVVAATELYWAIDSSHRGP